MYVLYVLYHSSRAMRFLDKPERGGPMKFALALLVLLAPGSAFADTMSDGVARALVHDLSEMIAPPEQLQGGGNKVILQGIELGNVDDKHLNARIRLRYQKSKGFPQYSTSGVAHARWTVYPGND